MHPRFVCEINIHGISAVCLLCGPEKWRVDPGPIYTERLFGAAMKNFDETLFLVLRFLRATPFSLCLFSVCFMVWPVFVVFSYPVRC